MTRLHRQPASEARRRLCLLPRRLGRAFVWTKDFSIRRVVPRPEPSGDAAAEGR